MSDDNIIIERVVPWAINGKAQTAFMCTPDHLLELPYGYLIMQGIVDSAADIISVEGGEEGLRVQVREGAVIHKRDISERLSACRYNESDYSVGRGTLRAMCARLLGDETYYGTHRLMLAYDGQEVFREDIGRHNAADKVIAGALQSGWDLSRCVLGATGRISLEMLAKAAVAGIPVFFSRKYPSDLGIQWAQKLGIALVARAHTDAPQVYGAEERIF